jgi:hypothetical protein
LFCAKALIDNARIAKSTAFFILSDLNLLTHLAFRFLSVFSNDPGLHFFRKWIISNYLVCIIIIFKFTMEIIYLNLHCLSINKIPYQV